MAEAKSKVTLATLDTRLCAEEAKTKDLVTACTSKTTLTLNNNFDYGSAIKKDEIIAFILCNCDPKKSYKDLICKTIVSCFPLKCVYNKFEPGLYLGDIGFLTGNCSYNIGQLISFGCNVAPSNGVYYCGCSCYHNSCVSIYTNVSLCNNSIKNYGDVIYKYTKEDIENTMVCINTTIYKKGFTVISCESSSSNCFTKCDSDNLCPRPSSPNVAFSSTFCTYLPNKSCFPKGPIIKYAADRYVNATSSSISASCLKDDIKSHVTSCVNTVVVGAPASNNELIRLQ